MCGLVVLYIIIKSADSPESPPTAEELFSFSFIFATLHTRRPESSQWQGGRQLEDKELWVGYITTIPCQSVLFSAVSRAPSRPRPLFIAVQ